MIEVNPGCEMQMDCDEASVQMHTQNTADRIHRLTSFCCPESLRIHFIIAGRRCFDSVTPPVSSHILYFLFILRNLEPMFHSELTSCL